MRFCSRCRRRCGRNKSRCLGCQPDYAKTHTYHVGGNEPPRSFRGFQINDFTSSLIQCLFISSSLDTCRFFFSSSDIDELNYKRSGAAPSPFLLQNSRLSFNLLVPALSWSPSRERAEIPTCSQVAAGRRLFRCLPFGGSYCLSQFYRDFESPISNLRLSFSFGRHRSFPELSRCPS